MNIILTKKQAFYCFLLTVCLLYFAIQWFYTAYAIWGVDDFWFAHWIYQYKSGLPYRDFSPYKTVLGYYFLLPSMLISHELLIPLYSAKNFIAAVNAILFFMAAIGLKRFFSKAAVLSSLILIIYAEFVLSYSANIRVDFLAYWFCFFAVLFVLDNKFILAGIVIGLGFLTSQKALWYIVATNAALGVYGLCFTRHWQYLRQILQFNLALIFTVLLYILFWAHFSSISTVLHNMFYEAYVMYKLDSYDSARSFFWSIALTRSPLLFMLWPVTFLSLLIVPVTDTFYKLRLFAIIYASVIILCLVPYKQVFPYYMLTTVPAFLLLYSAFFSWFFQIISTKTAVKILFVDKLGLWALAVFYFFGLIFLKCFLTFPMIYLLVGFIPVFLVRHCEPCEAGRGNLVFIMSSILLFVGIIYPLKLFSLDLLQNNGAYQKKVVVLTNELLKNGGDYVAGIELIYDKNQPIQSLRHLDVPGLLYLSNPNKKLRESMLSSLYHTPDANVPDAIRLLQQSQVKLYVNNYRIHALPMKIKKYLLAQYEHLWGSVYLYAPSIQKGQQSIKIKFTGRYQLESVFSVTLDQKTFLPNAIIQLTAGEHISNADADYRLKLLPDDHVQSLLNNQFVSDTWEKVLG